MQSKWRLKNKRVRLKKLYLFLKEKRWHVEGQMLFFSILALISYVALTVNIVFLIMASKIISASTVVLIMLAILSLFVFMQYRLTRYNGEGKVSQTIGRNDKRIKPIINRLSKSTALLCVYAVIEMFYLYVTATYAKLYSKSAIYGLCAFGLILYLGGLIMLHRLSVVREQLNEFRQ
jgi:hypothetical protein